MKSLTRIQMVWIGAIAVTGILVIGYVLEYSATSNQEQSVTNQTSTSTSTSTSISTSTSVSSSTPSKPQNDTPPSAVKCIRAGCSSQLCVKSDKNTSGTVTTCEFRPEYACYQTAKCELQTSGVCGWTMTTELTSCLANPPGNR